MDRPVAPMRPLEFKRYSRAEMRTRADEFLTSIRRRRTVRDFSKDPIPLDVVKRCIEAAATAPSGANKQPWTFVLVTDATVKTRIREAAEQEEHSFYAGRAGERWLQDLKVLGTDEHKPFLETAPALIVVFAQRHGKAADERHYYVQESVGIACGLLLAALHLAGLATLTHTPSPMGFLSKILGRPHNERAYLLIPVGYPKNACTVPNITKKALADVLIEM
jgi:nitroreductase